MITVFIGTYNRIDTLSRTIASYRKLNTPYELVIVDNGTNHDSSLKLLEEVEKLPEVKHVYSLPKVETMEALTDNYNVAVRDQYRQPKRSKWFAITDADICFDGSSPNSLKTYITLARATGNAVGPHTRVDGGIPMGYPLRTRVLATEARLLYKSAMRWYKKIPYAPWAIDTTFHLFPATAKFRRLGMSTLRVGPPYDAMHLDWYLDIFNQSEENRVYITELGGIGSWGRNWIGDFWMRFQENREEAWEFMQSRPLNQHDDFCITSFILSWGYQIGLGGKTDLAESVRCLHRAMPDRFEEYWQHEPDWMDMIYENDFSSLGWAA